MLNYKVSLKGMGEGKEDKIILRQRHIILLILLVIKIVKEQMKILNGCL